MTPDINSALAPYGRQMDSIALERLDLFHRMLVSANRQMDLTSVPEEEMADRHYLDSLVPAVLYPDLFTAGLSVCDVGSGAGFPGIPLAILLPELSFTLLESMKKRCDFLESAAGALGLSNVRVLCARAEDAGRSSLCREHFDRTVSRAVSRLPVLLEYMLPLTAQGGMAVCWKGPAAADEITESLYASSLLGGGAPRSLPLPALRDAVRTLIVVDKTEKTPAAYPRRTGIPLKRPL